MPHFNFISNTVSIAAMYRQHVFLCVCQHHVTHVTGSRNRLCCFEQAVSAAIWRPLKAHQYRGLWDVGHHWLGRLAMLLAVAAAFTGIYISAVGWGYYVAYGAAIAVFVLLMALKDIIDTLTVTGTDSCEDSLCFTRQPVSAA